MSHPYPVCHNGWHTGFFLATIWVKRTVQIVASNNIGCNRNRNTVCQTVPYRKHCTITHHYLCNYIWGLTKMLVSVMPSPFLQINMYKIQNCANVHICISVLKCIIFIHEHYVYCCSPILVHKFSHCINLHLLNMLGPKLL